MQEAWLAALVGQHGYLTGKDAEVAACDAVISPVVTGHPDLAVVDAMIDIVLGFLDATEDGEVGSTDCIASDRGRLLSSEAWQALRYAMARLAIDLVSGPDRLAAILRQGLLDAPYNSRSVPLDIGVSASIPGSIRRAVQLRARHCEWPGCDKPPSYCDIHHLVHQAHGGETSVRNCAMLCQFHHDICIHRLGWRLVLHPDGTTTAYGPKGQVVHSHGPPGTGPPGKDPPDDKGPTGHQGGLDRGQAPQSNKPRPRPGVQESRPRAPACRFRNDLRGGTYYQATGPKRSMNLPVPVEESAIKPTASAPA